MLIYNKNNYKSKKDYNIQVDDISLDRHASSTSSMVWVLVNPELLAWPKWRI